MKSIAFADERGESLVEVLVSVAIMAIVLTTFLSALSTGSFATRVVHERVTAENIARLQLEHVKETGFIAVADHYTPATISHPGYTAAISATSVCSDMQLITVTVSHNGETLFTIANYKVNQE